MTKITIKAKPLTALLLAVGLSGCGGDVNTNSDYTAVDPTVPVSDWKLVWSDEFAGSSIDQRKWTFEVDCRGGGNQEKQCYTDSAENAFVSEGTLKIVARPAADGAPQPYTSARLNTKYQGDWKYGRIEVRAKAPSGQGSWPAIWMMPTDEVYGGWPKSGEIDIFEAVNLKTVDAEGNVEASVHGTLHYGREWPNNSNSGKSYTLPTGANPADSFNTYAIEWQEGEIRWYVNDYLYQTQQASRVRTNSRGELIGLSHRGWFAEYFNQVTGKLETQWNAAPFDQRFYLILNLAVGGNWPENVNNLGIDAEAFANGQTFEVDWVRVYECQANPNNGKGCETIRAGYLDAETLVTGEAPIPSPPSTGIAQNLTIFDGTPNPNWPAWDCCGGSTPALVEDAARGQVYEFLVGPQPTVNGFITRSAFITDAAGTPSPFDASPLIERGSISFDMQVVSPPSNSASNWIFKVESNENTTFVELPITASSEGVVPVTGAWQTYTFPLKMLDEAGLDLSAIDAIMIFPAWDTGNGAVYRVDNVKIAQPAEFPELVIFNNGGNTDWPMWDCCGGSTPIEVLDEELNTLTAEFSVGATPTVLGFNNRAPLGGGNGFDAAALLADGIVQFSVKVVNAPANASSTWMFKIEAAGGDSAVELPLSAGNGGQAPVTGQWATYTFSVQSLFDAGLDISAIDVLMVFPAWDTGSGAVFRMHDVRIFNPNANNSEITIFRDAVNAGWNLWDCCAGSVPQVVDAEAPYGKVAQFEIFGSAETVLGFEANDDAAFDASAILANGSVSFDLRVVSAPSNSNSTWLFKIESSGAATAVELPLAAGNNGQAPVTGEWQRYRFSLQSLFDAGLDISDINVLMIFPAWGTGQGAVYQIDNVEISNN